MLGKQHHSVLCSVFWSQGDSVLFKGWGAKHSFNSFPYQLVNNRAQKSCVPALLLTWWMVLCFTLHRLKPQDVK